MTTLLAREIRKFNRIRLNLLREAKGKYALIYKDELIGTYDSISEAHKVGYENFGNVSFLVKEIVKVDPVYFIG